MFSSINTFLMKLLYSRRLKRANKMFGEAIMAYPNEKEVINAIEEFMLHQMSPQEFADTLHFMQETQFKRYHSGEVRL